MKVSYKQLKEDILQLDKHMIGAYVIYDYHEWLELREAVKELAKRLTKSEYLHYVDPHCPHRNFMWNGCDVILLKPKDRV